ncbi:MAG: hypothetical protein JXM72_07225 [Deltaproteobacteria bacterium]|nr:hypothetical protein [Deltaproteobacteria bacterium]
MTFRQVFLLCSVIVGLTVTEMEKYLSLNVPKQARTLYNREQTPVVRGDKSKLIVVLK